MSARRLGVSYSRFSDPKQAGGDSTDRQEREYRAFCERHNLTPGKEVFADRGRSGYSGEHRTRGKLGQLLEAAKAGRFESGTVVVIEGLGSSWPAAPGSANGAYRRAAPHRRQYRRLPTQRDFHRGGFRDAQMDDSGGVHPASASGIETESGTRRGIVGTPASRREGGRETGRKPPSRLARKSGRETPRDSRTGRGDPPNLHPGGGRVGTYPHHQGVGEGEGSRLRPEDHSRTTNALAVLRRLVQAVCTRCCSGIAG